MIKEEITLGRQEVYNGKIINLVIHQVGLSDGTQTQREIVEHQSAVCIVAIDDQEQIILVNQYRKATNGQLLEIPAGGIEIGEKPSDAARRELLEETGASPKSLIPLASFYTAPGFCTEFMYAFLATQISFVDPQPAEDENIEIVSVPLSDILTLVEKQQIKDSKTIACLMMVLHKNALKYNPISNFEDKNQL